MDRQRRYHPSVSLGIVDCDTSHMIAFSQQLHHKGVPRDQLSNGARIVAVCPGTSAIKEEMRSGFM
jgi:hypothetical protein